MAKVVGLGAGGHAKVVIDILMLMGGYELEGMLDADEALWGTDVMGVPVLGGDDLLPGLMQQGVDLAFIGLGSAPDTRPRAHLYDEALRVGFRLVSAIHPGAIVARSAEIGHGPTIMAGAIINPSATLGNNVIINTGAVVEHDCIIGDHVHLATGARLAGTVSVGPGSHIGAGAVVRQDINIGEGAIVAAGAAVVQDVEPGTTVAGVPARILKPSELDRSDAYSVSNRVAS